jgi:predicted nucleic acid-binding protein
MKGRTLVDLFADSYAFVAFVEGNERYRRIFQRKELATSAMNVLEVYATLLRRLSQEEARKIVTPMMAFVTAIPPEVAIPAGQFRHQMRAKGKDCSYIDAWGYAASQSLGVPFLTGDTAFRGITGVEFVR